MSINERIKYLRTELLKDTVGKKMSLEDFGARLSIGKTAVSKIEKGENNVTDRIVRTICREFNVREEWLKDGIGEPFVKLDREEELMAALGKVMASEPDSFRRRWMAVFAQLTEAEWDTLESIFFRLFDAKKED